MHIEVGVVEVHTGNEDVRSTRLYRFAGNKYGKRARSAFFDSAQFAR